MSRRRVAVATTAASVALLGAGAWHELSAARRAPSPAAAAVAAIPGDQAVGRPTVRESALARWALDQPPMSSLRLPPELRELSGLAVLPDGSWLAHDDERGTIYRRAARGGSWARFITFDGDERRGDFEAITLHAGRVWLQQSDGRRRGRSLAAARAVADLHHGDRAPCEVESLLAEGTFWWAFCKRTGLEGGLLAVRQPQNGGRWTQGWRISAKSLRAAGLPGTLGIADATRDARTGHWLLVAGPERWIVEVTPTGELIGGRRLDADRHPQPEGLAIGADGALLIGDEGNRHGRVSAYAERKP